MADLSSMQALLKELTGVKDPRGPVGMFGRGKNIYNTISHTAHSGGGSQFGRPRGTGKNQKEQKRQAALRRLRGNRTVR